MTSPFLNAIELAERAQAAFAGQEIVYHAGTIQVQITDAVQGHTQYESVDENGATLRSRMTDWLIMVASLVSNNQSIEPTPGHRITHSDGTTTRTYEVQKMGDEGCYRFSGPAFTRYRIHVREIPT